MTAGFEPAPVSALLQWRPPLARLVFFWLPGALAVALGILLAGMLLHSAAAQAEDADARGGSGELWLQAGTESPFLAVLGESELQLDIVGMLVTATLQQEFQNNSDEWVEAVYQFPLPPDAAVRDMTLELADRTVRSVIRERKSAQVEYRRAIAAGKQAALLQQQRPNLFSVRIGNVAPGETVKVRLRYLDRVDYRDGAFSLRFPMTSTPRYAPAGEARADAALESEAAGWQLGEQPALAAGAVASGTAGSSPHSQHIRIQGRLRSGLPLLYLNSEQHALVEAGDRFYLAREWVPMDRDFVLHWAPQPSTAPQAALLRENIGGDSFVSLMVLPPSVAVAPSALLPRDVVFVLDTSGSMAGASLRQAKAALLEAINAMQAGDRFNIVAFDTAPRSLYPALASADWQHKQQAAEFVRLQSANGGTEMSAALRKAIGVTPAAAERLQQLVFITDGAVSNEQALFSLLNKELGQRRLFTVGIGSAPNGWFMRHAALVGRGSATFIARQRDVAPRMGKLLEKLRSPLARDLQVVWQGDDDDGELLVDAYPTPLPDLYLDEPLLLVARLQHQAGQPFGVEVSGTLRGQRWQRELHSDGSATPLAPEQGAVAVLWARQRIASLLRSRQLGVSERAVRDSVLPLALQYGLLSPYTSRVAIAEEVRRPAEAGLAAAAVPALMPAGSQAGSAGWPATATHWRARAWLACLLATLALFVLVLRREDGDADRG